MKKLIVAFLSILFFVSCNVERREYGIVKSIEPGKNERYSVKVEFRNLQPKVPFSKNFYSNKFDIANNNLNVLDTVVLDSKGDYYLGRCIKIRKSKSTKNSEAVKLTYTNNNTWNLWFVPVEKGKFKVGNDIYLKRVNDTTEIKPIIKQHNKFVE